MMLPAHLKKLGLLSLLFISVLSIRAQCTTPISTFPYVEDFEASAAWTTSGPPCTPLGLIIDDWQWGTPSKSVISGAASGTKCWNVGTLTGSFYAYGERSWVQSPCFDFTTLQRPYFQFKLFYESEYKFDGANLQYSLDAGTTWIDVGAYGDATDCMDTNWYNYTDITNLTAYSHSLPGHGTATQTYPSLTTGTSANGWCGNIQANFTDTTGISTATCQGGHGLGHWLTSKHCMPYLASKPSVIFRFTFGAGSSCNDFNGFSFDSVAIGEGTPNSADFTHTCVNTTTVHFSGVAPLCPDTFQWNFGDPGSGASNTILGAGNLNPTHTFSAPGTYSVTFTIKGGPCNAPGSVTKTINIIGLTTTTTPVLCSGGNTGTASAIVAGSAAPYTYAWSSIPTQLTDTATGLTANTYHVTVTTPNACSATATAIVSQPLPLSHTSTTTPSICTANNGTAKVAEANGTAPYTYLWSNSLGTADSIMNAGPGTYVVTATDSKGCTDTAHVIITQGGGISASVSGTANETCHGDSVGSITISPAGGATPYTYDWGSVTTVGVNTLSHLAAGKYTITVTDNNGCTTTVADSISQPPAFANTIITTTTLCGASNGTAKVIETGGTPGYAYNWNSGLGTADSIMNQPAGTYTLTVTDSKGCLDTVPVTISNTGGVTATIGTVTNVTCPGGSNGSIMVNAANGTLPYTYHWTTAITNNNNTQGGFIAGGYIITVTDNSGCLTTVTTTISQPPLFSHTVTSVPTTCGLNNGAAKVLEQGGTPGYTYLWSNGLGTADSIMNAGAATYVLSITDAAGCHDTAAATIAATPVLIASLSNSTDDSCYGQSNGSITIAAANGALPYTYQWGSNTTTTPDSVQTGFAAGSYIITVTDANNCSVNINVNIGQPGLLTAIPTETDATCNGGNDGTVSLAISGGNNSFTYQWTNTNQTTQTITALTANTYAVTVTDNKGCTKDTFATVGQPQPFALTFGTIVNDSCSYSRQGMAILSVIGSTPAYTYNWSNGTTSDTLSGVGGGTYVVTVSDINHCTTVDSVSITAPPPIAISPAATGVTCHNDSNGTILIGVTGGMPGYTYQWSDDSTTASISHLRAGSYVVTVTDSWLCTAVSSAIVVANPDALTASAAIVPQSCASQADGSVSLDPMGGTPGYNYMWSPASGAGAIITGLTTGSYLYTVTDNHGCTLIDSAVVPLSAAIIVQAAVTQPLCPPINDGSILLTPSGGSPGYTYIWSNATNHSANASLSPGTYVVTVTDSRGCTGMDTFILAYQHSLTVDAGLNDTIDLGQTVTLVAIASRTTGGISYDWSPSYGLSCAACQATDASPLQTITYYVIASDTGGCSATDSVVVFVNKVYNLYVPNAFTPNGNGTNDYFSIFGDKASWKYVGIDIYDRWGEKVFESTDLDFKWDGTYRGKMEGPNVYVYVLTVTFIDGHSTGVLKGSLSLIR